MLLWAFSIINNASMLLKQLQIKGFRNLQETQITPINGVNLILGDNASGKTSILEAIYYLSHVRSFRTQYVTDLIFRQNSYLQLVASVETNDGNTIPFGIRRSRNKSEIRVNKTCGHRFGNTFCILWKIYKAWSICNRRWSQPYNLREHQKNWKPSFKFLPDVHDDYPGDHRLA